MRTIDSLFGNERKRHLGQDQRGREENRKITRGIDVSNKVKRSSQEVRLGNKNVNGFVKFIYMYGCRLLSTFRWTRILEFRRDTVLFLLNSKLKILILKTFKCK